MTPMTGQRAGHGLGPTRALVLRHLLRSEGGVSVQAVSEVLGIHANTARFHLEALVDAHYASRSHDRSQGQGRPRTLYRATDQAPVVETAHLRDLTQVLVRQLILSAPDPDALAEDVGRAWGREIGEAAASTTGVGGDEVDGLLEHTAAMGFAGNRAEPDRIEFHSCPYRGVQQPARASICRMHLGMMRGYLEASGADLEVAELTPGQVCVARLVTRPTRVSPQPRSPAAG